MPIEDLVGVLPRLTPIDDVEGKALHDGPDYLVALPVLVDELALVARTNVQALAVADDALLGVVEVAVANLTNRYLAFLNLHG